MTDWSLSAIMLTIVGLALQKVFHHVKIVTGENLSFDTVKCAQFFNPISQHCTAFWIPNFFSLFYFSRTFHGCVLLFANFIKNFCTCLANLLFCLQRRSENKPVSVLSSFFLFLLWNTEFLRVPIGRNRLHFDGFEIWWEYMKNFCLVKEIMFLEMLFEIVYHLDKKFRSKFSFVFRHNVCLKEFLFAFFDCDRKINIKLVVEWKLARGSRFHKNLRS